MSTNFDWAFNLNRMMLNMIGIWPGHVENDFVRSLRAPFVGLWIFFVIFLPQIYALVLVHRQLPLLIDNVITSCSTVIAIIKIFFIWYNRQVFEQLISCMVADWADKKNTWEYKVMIKQARRGRLFTMSGYTIMLTTMIFIIVTPFLNLRIRTVNNITDLDEKRLFPLQTFYPYDFTKTPYFELTYLMQLVAIGFAGFSFSAADNFFGAIVFHASGQCEILAARMTRLCNITTTLTPTPELSKNKRLLFKLKIQHMVEFHGYLIRFVFAIEKSFNLIILAHTLGLSFIICFIGFGVLDTFKQNSASTFVQIFSLVAPLMNMLIHMLIYCIATETLTSNSAEFLQAIYNCNWLLLPSKCAPDIILIMARSHFPLKLTAGKFFELSMNTFIWVLRTSVGYISMLVAVS